jgi:purine-binding chemotaxis protein CheW
MLAFLLGGEEYVLPVDQVHEVLKLREITPVPHTPDYLLGVCSLRGTVLPVVDLARRLGFAAGACDDKSRILVTGPDADDRIGLLVDRVKSVVRFPASSVRPVPDTVERGMEFLRGIARRDQRLIILLDVEKAAAVG